MRLAATISLLALLASSSVGAQQTAQVSATSSGDRDAGQAGAPRDEYSISLNGWQSDTGEASSDLIQLVASSNPEKGRGAILRPSHYGNPEIDAIIERSLTVLDTPQREDLYRQATRLGMQDAAIIPLHHQVNLFALRRGLAMLPRMQEGIRAWEITEK